MELTEGIVCNCNSHNVRFDPETGMYHCLDCFDTWFTIGNTNYFPGGSR